MFKKSVLAFVLLLTAGLSQSLMACLCSGIGGPPCEASGNADGIFLGRVVEISSFKVNPDSALRSNRTFLRVRFLVESGFRGVAAGTFEVTTDADSGGGCGYAFELNRRYVVYAYRGADNSFGTSICTRTRRVENAAEDLSFFGGLATAPLGARIFGQLGLRENVPLLSEPQVGPMAGARVVVEGRGGPWETVTDKQGRYQIAGLPPGDYEVKPQADPQRRARFDPPSKKVKLIERGCAEMNAYGQVRGRISGWLTDPDGRPVPEQLVEILPEGVAPLDGRPFQFPYAVATKDGFYEFDALPSGRYLVGLSLRLLPRAFTEDRFVYPRTYFPSAVEMSEARVVELAAGEIQQGINIVLPRPLKNRTLRGIVVWSDGKRAKGARVRLLDPEYPETYEGFAETDAEGAFSLKGHESLSYVIEAASDIGPDGKPLRGQIVSSPIPVKDEQTTVTLPFPATLKSRLVDVNGEPAANVEVELIAEEARGWKFLWPHLLRAMSDEKGRFEISGIAPRRYVLAIHASSPPRQSVEYVYPPAFYPGTIDRNLAAVIELKEGQSEEFSDFVLPARLTPGIAEGIVIWPDGRAVQSGYIVVEDLDFPGWTDVARAQIASDGRFALSLFVGRRYVIRAMTSKDQEGRESLWQLKAAPAEILVDSKSMRFTIHMPE